MLLRQKFQARVMPLRQKFQPFYKGVTGETFGFSFSFSNFLLEGDFVIVISKTTKQERGEKKKKKRLGIDGGNAFAQHGARHGIFHRRFYSRNFS